MILISAQCWFHDGPASLALPHHRDNVSSLFIENVSVTTFNITLLKYFIQGGFSLLLLDVRRDGGWGGGGGVGEIESSEVALHPSPSHRV